MSKKFFYVAALLAGLVFTGTSCADDKGDNDDDDDDAIDLAVEAALLDRHHLQRKGSHIMPPS